MLGGLILSAQNFYENERCICVLIVSNCTTSDKTFTRKPAIYLVFNGNLKLYSLVKASQMNTFFGGTTLSKI